MCGINGIRSFLLPRVAREAAVNAMNVASAHRGPDDAGVWSTSNLTLGHRRLSILDLSAAGHQPMASACGRYHVAYNGELYNFRALRAQLDYPFVTQTDTEVLLAAWQRWGAACLEKLDGMYGFALWDNEDKTLHLVRDRLGIKPIYYWAGADNFLFSSEIRPLLASNLVPRRLNRAALSDFLRYQTLLQPTTLIQDVRMLPAASHLILSDKGLAITRYWTPWSKPNPDLAHAAPKVVLARIKETLGAAVERQLVADVPFGIFLSGGIDSAALVALASQVTGKLSTFCVDFAEPRFSEARYAAKIAADYRTEHHLVQLHPKDFLARLPAAIAAIDHPSADGLNQYVVAGLARQSGLRMALSGLGGDEIFAGYPVFARSARLSKLPYINRVPRVLRRGLMRGAARLRQSISMDKLAAILGATKVDALSSYPYVRQVFLDEEICRLLPQPVPPNPVAALAQSLLTDPVFAELPGLSQISALEIASYMEPVLLRDADQMSMAHGLEVRVPFLDHQLVELMFWIPDALKLDGTPKPLLVGALGDALPKDITQRPKQGFVMPFATWIKNELRAFCQARLERLAQRNLGFNQQVLNALWESFLRGDPRASWPKIWLLVVLEDWLDRNGVGE